MIRYALKCPKDHQFESWFQSADAFEKLHAAGHVGCAVCGDPEVTKAVMAPSVSASRNRAAPSAPAPVPTEQTPGPLSAPASEIEAAFAKLRKHIETTSDYVGKDFAKEARRIHDGDALDRPIYGEARAQDARRLIEDGVPVAPLPFLPARKTN